MILIPRRYLRLLGIAGFAAILETAPAQEVQPHGLMLKQWVRDTFFDRYTPASDTQKWDIPASAHTRFGGLPVSSKAARYGTPVDLGDALRQRRIDEPFMLAIGFRKQEGDEKRFVQIVAPRIEPATWAKLWGPGMLAKLQHLDAVIKEKSLTPEPSHAAALKLEHAPQERPLL